MSHGASETREAEGQVWAWEAALEAAAAILVRGSVLVLVMTEKFEAGLVLAQRAELAGVVASQARAVSTVLTMPRRWKRMLVLGWNGQL